MNDIKIKSMAGLFILAILGLFMLILPIYSIIPSIYNNYLYMATIFISLSSLSILYLICKN